MSYKFVNFPYGTPLDTMSVGGIGNYYGELEILQHEGSYFWAIADYDGTDWEEIPKFLYEALVRFEEMSKIKPISE